jgi:drug/metabolite transporter (DMT)-like permease
VLPGMNWLFFALLAPAVFTVVNFGDKYILEKEIRDARGMPIFAGIMAFLAGIVLWILTGFPVLTLPETLLVLFTGAITNWASAIYFQAMQQEEASKVIVLIQMVPVVVLALSVVFLQEPITPGQMFGFVLILGAALGIALNRETGGIRISPAFWQILLVDVLWGASIVLFKYAAVNIEFERVIAFESWGLALGGLTLYLFVPPLRHAFHHSLTTARKGAFAMIAVNESLFVVAKLLNFWAVALGPVALVSVLGSTQIFYGILFGWLLTVFAPAILREDVSQGSIQKKAGMAALFFVGIWLVNL